jgi:hypothetical protein
MERGTRRAHQGKNRRRNRPGEGAVLGMVDDGACGGEVRRLRQPKRDGMRAEGCGGFVL